MKGLVVAGMLFSMQAFAAVPNDQVDLRYYPPDPAKVLPAKLPVIVPGLASGMPYLKARKLILGSGWSSLDLRDREVKEEPDCVLLECQLHRRHIFEVDGCPMDRGTCTFYYRKGKRWLQLMTYGEELGSMLVYYWAPIPPESFNDDK